MQKQKEAEAMAEEVHMPETNEAESRAERPLEELFDELDGILEKMQAGDVTLEESFALYETGMKDIRQCTGMLDQIEKKMLMLSREGELEPFDGDSDI